MEYQRVYITQDNDGHDYVIPYEMREEFDHMLEMSEYVSGTGWEDREEEFNDKFSTYMTGGDINEAEELYIKVK